MTHTWATCFVVLLYLTLVYAAVESPIDTPETTTQTNRAQLNQTNDKCEIGQVAYAFPSTSNDTKCGQCVPGYAGWNDPYKLCPLNAFCNDVGVCIDLMSSTFWQQPCPYETGGLVSTFCGPGLRCIEHKCVICRIGERDLDGKTCTSLGWAYTWTSVTQDSQTALMVAILVFVLIGVLAPFIPRLIKVIRKLYKIYRRRMGKDEEVQSAVGLREMQSSSHEEDGERYGPYSRESTTHRSNLDTS